MNIYDTVNKLAYEIRCSEEYVVFKQIRQDVKMNTNLSNKIAEFEKIRYTEQLERMKNGKPNEELLNNMKEKYSDLLNIELARKYFDAELKFNMLITDINKTIADTVKDIYN